MKKRPDKLCLSDAVSWKKKLLACRCACFIIVFVAAASCVVELRALGSKREKVGAEADLPSCGCDGVYLFKGRGERRNYGDNLQAYTTSSFSFFNLLCRSPSSLILFIPIHNGTHPSEREVSSSSMASSCLSPIFLFIFFTNKRSIS